MHCKCGNLVEPPYEAIGKCENCFAEACENQIDVYKEEPRPDIISEEKALELPVADLELNDKAENYLSDMDIVFIKDLVKKTEKELMSMRGFGKKTLTEIKDRLLVFNLSLKEENPSRVLSL